MPPIQAVSSVHFSSKGSQLCQLRAKHREAVRNNASNKYNLEVQIQALEAIAQNKRMIREARHAMGSSPSNHWFMGKLIAPSEMHAIMCRAMNYVVSNRGILENLQGPVDHSDRATFDRMCKQVQRERSAFGKPKGAKKIAASIPGYRPDGTIGRTSAS